jgi:cytochrome c biogenesis protein CcmG/thiol:disulfide interchange protein DsbE
MDDDPAAVRTMARRLQPDYPIIMGDARLGTEYGGVLGLPITYLVDRGGTIIARFDGEANLGRMEREIRKLLAQR